jgi:hypothetical protein
LIFRRREDNKNGNFNFGVVGLVANVFALGKSFDLIRDSPARFANPISLPSGWSILAIPLFCMPTLKVVTTESMNYASVVFFGFVLIAAIWYGVWGYNNYRGPPTDAVEHDDDQSLPEATEVLGKATDLPGKSKSP